MEALILTFFKSGSLFAAFISYSFVCGDIYSTCYEYETYCLFSFGPNVTVNNVKEAQKICEDAKHGSWLLEILDEKTLKNVQKFISYHQFPENVKLIINAEKIEDGWRWIRERTRIDLTLGLVSDKKEIQFSLEDARQIKNEKHRSLIICMTECYSKVTKHVNKRLFGATHHVSVTKRQCLEKCEQSECQAWEWRADDDDDYGCWIHKTIIGPMTSSIGTVFALDRSAKTPAICLRNARELTAIYCFVSLILLIASAAIIAVIVYWRKRRRKTPATMQDSRHGRNASYHLYDEIGRNVFNVPGSMQEILEEPTYMSLVQPASKTSKITPQRRTL